MYSPLVKLPSDVAVTSQDGGAKVEYFPMLRVTHRRGYYVGSLGVLPTWVWPILKKIHPWYHAGSVTAVNFTRLAITVISQRLEIPTDRLNILGKLIQGKDDEGKLVGLPELAGETIGYLNAGMGTTSG